MKIPMDIPTAQLHLKKQGHREEYSMWVVYQKSNFVQTKIKIHTILNTNLHYVNRCSDCNRFLGSVLHSYLFQYFRLST